MSYSTQPRPDPPVDSIGDALADALPLDGGGLLRVPASLQSWPGIVHGGGIVALFDRMALALGGVSGPRRLEARLTSSVPIDTPLRIEGRADADAIRVTILEGEQSLSAAAIAAFEDGSTATREVWTGGGQGWSLPTSDQCLACGALNPLGLQARLRFDAEGVWTRLAPQRQWSTAGKPHPALMPVLLDELSWWLGALVSKEGGLTNRITLTLHEPSPPVGAVVAAGRFDAVEPIDRRRAFWRTETMVASGDGSPIATATIVFRGGAEYSARQMEYFRARTSAELFRRMFPNHAG